MSRRILELVPVPAVVAVGGSLGALARWGVGTAYGSSVWAAVTVNATGCLLMGALMTAVPRLTAGRPDAARLLRPFLGVGILGGYTTFSAFALDATTLYGRGQAAHAAAYVVGSVAASVAAAALGLALTRP